MTAGFKVVVAGAGMAAAGLAMSQAAAEVARGAEGVGALRSPVSELARGLKFSVSQSVRYEDNLVRTANDAETLAVYGKDDASDIVSTTSLNAELSLKEERSELKFVGNLGYEAYSEYDDFSGVVGRARGEWDWYFSDRCSFGADAGLEWRLASFNDVDQIDENRQLETRGELGLRCFVIDRVRAGVKAFGREEDNDSSQANGTDLRNRGIEGELAYVSAKKNEVGVRYQFEETRRPNFDGFITILSGAPPVPVLIPVPVANGDYDKQTVEIFGKMGLGDRFQAEASIGAETLESDTGADSDRSSGELAVSWFPTERLAFGLDFVRAIEDASDIAFVTRETDRIGASVNWKAHPRATVGAFVRFEDDKLEDTIDSFALRFPDATDTVAPPGPPVVDASDGSFVGDGLGRVIDDAKEETFTAGASLRHSVFNRFEVVWSAGYTERSSDEPIREYESGFASVTVGLSF